MGQTPIFPSPRRALPSLLLFLSLTSMVLAGPARAAEPAGSGLVVSVDAPSSGVTVPLGQPIFIGGWAVDPDGPGTGVERVEVYLDGEAGAGGTPIRGVRYGTSRPDVAATYGRPEWSRSGFALNWRPRNLTPGDHSLYVYAQSAAGAATVTTVSITVSPEYTRRCSFVLPCLLVKDSFGWEIDYGGPGTFFQRGGGGLGRG